MSDERLTLSDLPKSLRPIAARFDMATVELVVARFGGTEIWVPSTWREGLPINELGTDLAQRLCQAFGGEHLLIPKTMTTPEVTERRVRALDAEGVLKRGEIARAVGLSERQVYAVLSRAPRAARSGRRIDPRQTSLLDRLGPTDEG